jgi:hypothetical protein
VELFELDDLSCQIVGCKNHHEKCHPGFAGLPRLSILSVVRIAFITLSLGET